MSNYKIVFSPELNLTADDFADSWNSLEACQKIAEAKIEQAAQNDFALTEISTIVALAGFLGGFSGEIVKDLVKDVIKDAIVKRFKKTPEINNLPPALEQIEIQQIEQPDGTKLLIVIVKQG